MDKVKTMLIAAFAAAVATTTGAVASDLSYSSPAGDKQLSIVFGDLNGQDGFRIEYGGLVGTNFDFDRPGLIATLSIDEQDFPVGMAAGQYVSCKTQAAECVFVPRGRTQDYPVEQLKEALSSGAQVKLSIKDLASGDYVVVADLPLADFAVSGAEPSPETAPAEEAAPVEAPHATETADAAQAALASNPIYKACENDYTAKNYFDCGCMAEKAPDYKNAAILGTNPASSIQSAEGMVSYRQKQVDLAKDKGYAAAQMKRLDDNLAEAQALLARLKNPDSVSFDSVDPQKIFTAMVNAGACKRTDWLAADQETKCMQAASSTGMIPEGIAAEDYCACVGEKAAALWLARADGKIRSSVIVQMATQARTACRP